MKKRIVLMIALFGIVFATFGCSLSTQDLISENISEVTKVYYMGECESFYCTLAIGEREENYLMNGQTSDKKDFALLSIVPEENNHQNLIKSKIFIDGVESEVELEINGLNHNFMVDLEKSLSGNEKIEVEFENKKIELKNISKNFGIDYLKALEIASVEMEDKILFKKQNKNLNSEFYLRILDKKANGFDGMFWCFTVVNIDNESYSVVFSAEDGEILAKS